VTIRAIETKYNGYRFRSRLEARWAVFFDTLGIPWQYEKEGYDLGPDGLYLPDFWFPAPHSFWAAVKPETPTEEEHRKGRALAVATRSDVDESPLRHRRGRA
jgi:hypothetical protein